MLVEKSRDGVVAVNDDNAVSGSCFSEGQGEIGRNNLLLASWSFGNLASLPFDADNSEFIVIICQKTFIVFFCSP